MTPSEFTSYPWDSKLQDANSERIAQNIMIILKRTGNQFRTLTWEEYKLERAKDGGLSFSEKEHFLKAMPHCKSAQAAKLFSKIWRI